VTDDEHRAFGAYDVQREVGRGGMGVVYLAIDRRLGRRVALKVIVPELAADPQFRQRFEREARVAATLEHPHVVPVYEAGEHDGSLFIAMRFIDGRDLATEVRDHGRLAPDRLGRIVLQVAGALDAAHRSGVVHRDVKPANVLLTGSDEDEQAYLTDFGLTREAAAESGLTLTGQWVGTVDYAAPEQILGEPTDARSDVYALGCLAFQSLTGAPPFQGAPAARLFAHMNEPPPSACAARPELDPEVDATLARALAKKPAERFQSAGDLGRAAAAAVITLIIGSGGGNTASYADKAKAAVADLARANRTLSERFTGLNPATPSATISTATTDTAAAARDAQRRVGALKAADDPALAGALTKAIDAEQGFLGQAGAAAASPSKADAPALQRAAGAMTDAFVAVSDKLDGLPAVEGISGLIGWVAARQAAGQRRQGADAFITAVDAVLAGARPGRRQIQQIHDAIDNATSTPQAASAGLDQVVANRQAALTGARNLSVTQTDQAGTIKSLLVESFQRSLDYDRDLQDGVAAYQNGDFERYLAKVFDDAGRSSQAATKAKGQFLAAYNRLRASRGRTPVGDDL
jgi:predicted Ser/Thr protein kinase